MSDSGYNYPFHKNSAKAMKRAGNQCEKCGMGWRECREEYDAPLETHHEKPVREFDDEDDAHSVDNLTLLCPRCHAHTERGVVTTDHSPETLVDYTMIDAVDTLSEPEVSDVINHVAYDEDVVRSSLARLVSGGVLEYTYKRTLVKAE